jgi:hypothetical protein
VWSVLWTVRPQLKGLLVSLPPAAAAAPRREAAGTPVTAPRPASVPKAAASGTPPSAKEAADARPAAWWVKQVSKDMALVPLKLLHILLAGYEPKAQRPQIRYRRPT